MCNYFDEQVLKQIVSASQTEIKFSDDLWHWIIDLVDLGIIEKFSVGDDFYRIKPHYQKFLQRYTNKQNNLPKLVVVFEECIRQSSNIQYLDLYKAEKIVFQIITSPQGVSDTTIYDTLQIFRYEKIIINGILKSLSVKFSNKKKVDKIYQLASKIPTRNNIDSIFIFPLAILLEKAVNRIRPPKFRTFPLYILSLVYQTWSNHEKAIETLNRAIDLID